MNGIGFNREEQHFRLVTGELELPEYPLTVTLQITRKCNLRCVYCSESEYLPDPTLEEIETAISNLSGTSRIIISGGEPTEREDLLDILETCRQSFDIVAMATNAINIDLEYAREMSSFLDYVDVTIDGPRNIHNRIRGSYDDIVDGIWNLKQAGIEYSVVMVLLDENRNYVSDVAQIADTLGAKKLKILSPIAKGRGKNLMSKRLPTSEIRSLSDRIKKQKKAAGWRVRIALTDWERIGEGHALLVHPTGDVVASPVWSKEPCIEYVGNILRERISEIWAKYPYKENHVKKYVEKTLVVH